MRTNEFGNTYVTPTKTKTDLLWWQEQGLSKTTTGYGGKIETTLKCQIPGSKQWYRIYVMIYSTSIYIYMNLLIAR